MKAVLEYKDGRRESQKYPGGILHHVTIQGEDGRIRETTFKAGEFVDDCIVFREIETKDVTARMREAAERHRMQTFRSLGIRPPAPGVFAKGMFPGETEEEHKRRVAIMNGQEPDEG